MATRSASLSVLLLACGTLLAGCTSPADRRLDAIESGNAHFEQGEFEKARVAFSTALQIEPEDAETLYRLALVQEKLKNTSRAISLFAGAIDVDPDHLGARAELARIYTLGGYPEDAIALVEEVLPRFPRDPGLLISRALAHGRLGDLDQARLDASIALAEDPSSERGTALLAGLLNSLGDLREADELLQRGIEQNPESTDLRVALAFVAAEQGDLDRAAGLLEETVTLRPGDDVFRYQLARFYLDSNAAERAEDVLRQLIERRPESLEARRALLEVLARERGAAAAEREAERMLTEGGDAAELKLMLADYYRSRDKLDERETLLTEVIDEVGEGPVAIDARRELATDYLTSGRVDDARELVSAILEESPRDTRGLALRGALRLADGDVNDAILDIRTALAAEPESTALLNLLADAYLRIGETNLAIETIQQSAAITPDDPAVRVMLARTYLAGGEPELAVDTLLSFGDDSVTPAILELLFESQLRAGDAAAATQTALRFENSNPGTARGAELLAIAAEQSGAPEGALANYRRALVIAPQSFSAVEGIVRTSLKLDDAATAVDAITSFIDGNPGHLGALNALARLYIDTGSHDDARRVAADAIEADAASPVGYMTLVRLARLDDDLESAISQLRHGFEATSDLTLGFSLAELLEETDAADEAIAVYEDILAIAPDTDPAANNLAMLLVTSRDDDSSLERAQALSARFVDSDRAAYLNTFGWVAYKAGNLQTAIPALRRAAQMAPDSALLTYHHGVALIAAGQVEEGKGQVLAALRTNDSFSNAAEARQLLRTIDDGHM